MYAKNIKIKKQRAFVMKNGIEVFMPAYVEVYNNERKAEFLLNNSLTRAEYKDAIEDVKSMGLNPKTISHINQLPVFNTVDEENAFWQQHDSTDYVNWKQAKVIQFDNLKPSIPNPKN